MSTPEPTAVETEAPPNRWQRARLPLLIAGPVVVVALAAYFYVSGGRYEKTDDAYVMAARTAISANVSGRVVELAVHDNQVVRRGDLLYRLDDTPFRISVAEAEAQLAAATLQIESLKATYLQRQADLASAKDTLAFQQSELARQKRLIASGIASQAQVDRATHSLDEARSRLASVQHEITGAVAQLGGDPNIDPSKHPAVMQARAALDRARLNLSYTTITAPGDGVVTRVEQLQVGNYVAASTPVFALVSTHDVWLEANFKEDQLGHMRAGQVARVRIDSYPGKTFTGRVASVSPGTGSQFSMLPPENATGNWVKVVQRLPVRVELDGLDADYPLHAGLSAIVDVDTQYQRHLFGSSEQLTDESGSGPGSATASR
ncbi:MAG TPA: HlyD family secretion protein [Steroidobacteraceae bacterium]|nr:HlyD family secretion protein [Steroidobacteraceae bacterium]